MSSSWNSEIWGAVRVASKALLGVGRSGWRERCVVEIVRGLPVREMRTLAVVIEGSIGDTLRGFREAISSISTHSAGGERK